MKTDSPARRQRQNGGWCPDGRVCTTRTKQLMKTRPIHNNESCLCLAMALCALSTFGGQAPMPAPKLTFLDNGEVRIGMDLALGGAVTFISSKEHPGNIINSADLGRQIQMSHYSGPWPFEVGNKKPNPAWAGLGWNPI